MGEKLKKIEELEAPKQLSNLQEHGEKIAEELIVDEESTEKIQKKYNRLLSIIDNAEKEDFRNIFKQKELKEIFSEIHLLTEQGVDNKSKKWNINQEMINRLATYTELQDGWFTLDYLRVNTEHEMNVGLGEILISPSIKYIRVKRANGEVVLGQRIENRRGFFTIDEPNQYIATFTGDKFQIIEEENLSEEYFLELAEKQRKTRGEFIEENKNMKNLETVYSSQNLKELQELTTQNKEEIELEEINEKNIDKYVKNAHEESQKKKKNINKYEDLKEQNDSLYYLMNKVCADLGINRAFFYGTVKSESYFTAGKIMGDKHLDGGSVGITQFRPETWKTITNSREFISYMKKFYPGKDKYERGENVLAGLVAGAVLTRLFAKQGGIDLTKNSLTNDELVYLRARFKGDKNANNLRNLAKKGEFFHPYDKFLLRVRAFEVNSNPELLKKKEKITLENENQLRISIINTAKNYIGSKEFTGDEVDGGNLACAQFVSRSLNTTNPKLLGREYLSVSVTVKALQKKGWKQHGGPAKAGDIVVWKKNKNGHSHIGVAINEEEAISNSSKLKEPRTHAISKGYWLRRGVEMYLSPPTL